jgi:nucleotide-binding universal stress UspA family protein
MTHTTIVVGVDGAWHRTGAVDWALDQALRSGAKLHLVHVVDDRFAQLGPDRPGRDAIRSAGVRRVWSTELQQGAVRVDGLHPHGAAQ